MVICRLLVLHEPFLAAFEFGLSQIFMSHATMRTISSRCCKRHRCVSQDSSFLAHGRCSSPGRASLPSICTLRACPEPSFRIQ